MREFWIGFEEISAENGTGKEDAGGTSRQYSSTRKTKNDTGSFISTKNSILISMSSNQKINVQKKIERGAYSKNLNESTSEIKAKPSKSTSSQANGQKQPNQKKNYASFAENAPSPKPTKKSLTRNRSKCQPEIKHIQSECNNEYTLKNSQERNLRKSQPINQSSKGFKTATGKTKDCSVKADCDNQYNVSKAKEGVSSSQKLPKAFSKKYSKEDMTTSPNSFSKGHTLIKGAPSNNDSQKTQKDNRVTMNQNSKGNSGNLENSGNKKLGFSSQIKSKTQKLDQKKNDNFKVRDDKLV